MANYSSLHARVLKTRVYWVIQPQTDAQAGSLITIILRYFCVPECVREIRIRLHAQFSRSCQHKPHKYTHINTQSSTNERTTKNVRCCWSISINRNQLFRRLWNMRAKRKCMYEGIRRIFSVCDISKINKLTIRPE